MANQVAFYGPMTQALGGNIQRDYQNDTSRRIAEQMMEKGSSTAPVQSPLEGITRALTGAVGGYFGGQAENAKRQREAQLSEDMQAVLAGGQQTMVADASGQPIASGGGFDGMLAALSGINNPDLAPLAMQLQMAKIGQDQDLQTATRERQHELTDAEKAFERKKELETLRRETRLSDKMDELTAANNLAASRDQASTLRDHNIKRAEHGLAPVSALPGSAPQGQAPAPPPIQPQGPQVPGMEAPQSIAGAKLAMQEAADRAKSEREAEQKKAAAMPAAQSKIVGAVQRLPVIQSSIANAKELAKSWTTSGIPQQIFGGVAGTDAFELDQALDTIKANVGFGELLRIKEAGGTLGALSEMENRLLQAVQGALDSRRSPEKLTEALNQVETLQQMNLAEQQRQFIEAYPDAQRPWEEGTAGLSTEDLLNKYAGQ